MSALLNIQRKLLKDGQSLDEVLKKYPFSYMFLSVIEAQTICKCFIGLFIMSLIFKRSRSTLAMSAKIMLRWACTFFCRCVRKCVYISYSSDFVKI